MRTTGHAARKKFGAGLSASAVAMLACFLCFSSKADDSKADAPAAAPEIRLAEKVPVADGKAVAEAWKNADVLTRFATPEKLNVARDQTEARVLFDDKNLYFWIKAFESSKDPIVAKKGASAFFGDNFEVFVQPDIGKPEYYQLAVSAAGDLHAAQGRNTSWKNNVRASAVIGKGLWEATLVVPLADIGLTPPEAGQSRKIRCNICRSDATGTGRASSTREEGPKAEASSFALLDVWDYHVAENWPEMAMTRNSGSAREITAKSPRLNLLLNPEFDIAEGDAVEGWGRSEDVVRQETMALSGEWIMRATGKAYVALQQWVRLEKGKEYTLKVKARRFGDDDAFGVIQLAADKAAKSRVREAGQPAWQVPLTTEFHEFNIPFVAAEDSVSLAFYRLGAKTTTSGVDFAAIHLYEGKLSPFEIRKVSRIGGKKPLPGTEISVPSNFFGAKKEKLKALAVAKELERVREYLDIFAGLNVECDILTTAGKDLDVYYTDGDPAAVNKRLGDKYYDLYMIGKSAVTGVGKELTKRISENVEAGAGLLINTMGDKGNFAALLAKHKPAPVAGTHYLRHGFPAALMPLQAPPPNKAWSPDPTEKIMETVAGSGKIVLSDTSAGTWQEFRIMFDKDSYAYSTFPGRKYSDAWLARLAYYAAGKAAPSMSGVSFQNDACEIGCEGGAKVRWRLEDKNGKLVSEGGSDVKEKRASISMPKMTLSGNHVMGLWLTDKDGSVLDYRADVAINNGPSITACESKKESYSGDDHGEFVVRTKDVSGDMKIFWELEDFSGRTLESGSVKAAGEASINVPLRHVHTNLARLWVRLRDGGRELDAQRFPVWVTDRDRKRQWNDYTVSIWPSTPTADTNTFIARQMEKIGVGNYLLPHHGPAVILNEGIGVGGEFRGGGDIFCALYPPKDNVRRPSLGDPAVLKSLAERATNIAKKELKYGVVNTAVCDEPNDAWPTGKDEIDAHPENLKEYRARMRAKYGSIEKFNERCSTSHKSFDEIGLVFTKDARTRDNFAEFVEWRNYSVDRWVEAIRVVSDNSKAVDPGAPLSLYNSFGQRALNGNDYWKLLTKAGLNFSHEYTTMVYMGAQPMYDFDELYRSFRPDMRVWGFNGYYWSKNHAAFQPWWFALHRYGGFCWFATVSGVGPGGGGRWLNLLDVPGFGLTEDAALLRDGLKESALLDGMGKLFLEYEWKKRDVAVLYSQPSLLVAWCRGKESSRDELLPGPYKDYFESRQKVRYMLEELLYQYDFIAPEQIGAGVLDSYKTLILPHIEALSDSDVQKIKAFVARGGTVVADIMPGDYDELGAKRKEGPFAGMSGEKFVLFEKTFDDKDTAQRGKMLRLLEAAGAEAVARCDDPVSTFGREAMRFTRGDMNVFAITRNFVRSDDSKTQTFTFPQAGHLYDLREGKYLGKTGQVSCAIPNAGTKVFGLYPYKVGGLKINAPSKVAAGSDLTADISVSVSEGKAGHHVFHVEVAPPSGEARWFMRRNAAAPEGRLAFVFRMAENDPPGKWTLRVKDVLTGTVAEKSFDLTAKKQDGRAK